MASQTPYSRLVGTWKIYLAPALEPMPNLDAAPAGNWVDIGATDGDQILRFTGTKTMFSDNSHTGPVKHVLAEESCEFEFSIVNLTLENMARVKGMATADVVTTTSGTYAVKRLPNARGYIPTRYALLGRGGAVEATNTFSAYITAGPAQLWIPQGIFDGEPELTFGKGSSPAPTGTFVAEADDTQAAGYQYGFLEMKSS